MALLVLWLWHLTWVVYWYISLVNLRQPVEHGKLTAHTSHSSPVRVALEGGLKGGDRIFGVGYFYNLVSLAGFSNLTNLSFNINFIYCSFFFKTGHCKYSSQHKLYIVACLPRRHSMSSNNFCPPGTVLSVGHLCFGSAQSPTHNCCSYCKKQTKKTNLMCKNKIQFTFMCFKWVSETQVDAQQLYGLK